MLIYAFLACLRAHICEHLQVLFALRCFSPAGFAASQQAKHMALQSLFTPGLAMKIGKIKGPVGASKEWLVSLSVLVCLLAFIVQNRCVSFMFVWKLKLNYFFNWLALQFSHMEPELWWVLSDVARTEHLYFSWPSTGGHTPTGVRPHPLLRERARMPNLSPNHTGLTPITAPDVNMTSLSSNELETLKVSSGLRWGI